MTTFITPYNELINDLLDSNFTFKSPSSKFYKLDFWQEKEEGFYAEKDIPGFSKKDISATLENEEICVEGEIESRGSSKSLKLKMKIPEDSDKENISLEVKDGILKIHFPKQQKAKPKKINVS